MEQAFRTATDILALLAKKRSESDQPVNEERRRLYQQAAAVLVSLREPNSLQPVGGGGQVGEGKRVLKTDLIPATGRDFEGAYMLHPEARREAIAELSTTQARLRALSANPHERKGSLQLQLERYLLGTAIPLVEQPPEQLDETLQIVTWLEGTLPDLPSVRDVKARLAFRSFSAPFESLAGDEVFRGRRKELNQLRKYIGVLAPEAFITRITDSVIQWVRPAALPALSISGPGGVGKSALVARFMLEHCRVAAEARILFSYLDFDRSILSITEPETLLAEILNQLDLQFEREGYFRALRDSVLKEMGAEKSSEASDSYSRVSPLIAQLMKLIEDRLGPRPFVIVLDTFEEVQYRGESLAFPLWEIFDRMQQSFPFLRIVISGRAPVKSLILAGREPEQMVLGDLDHDAAIGYLEGLGIKDRALAEMLVKQLGGVPLSLKLAASVVKRDGIERVSDISRKPSLFSTISDSTIQGVLFSRILGHLHDPVLERLAHPGLVLRRISAPVILNVLNEPCELGLVNLDGAQVLFEKLRRETSLVASDTLDGTLVHRPELRRTMLKLLLEKEPDKAAQINRAAVKWHASQSGWRAKAEELYHRLQLRQTPSDRGFEDPEIRSSLQSSISEVPPVAQRYLATLGYQIDEDVLLQASREEQDAALAAEVEELIPHGPRSVSHAEGLLEGFSRNHASPLFAAAARVAAQQERFDDAAKLLTEGLEKAFGELNSREALTLLSDQVWLWKWCPRSDDFAQLLSTFGEYARQYNLLPMVLQHRIQSSQKDVESVVDDTQSLREISALLKRLNSYELWSMFPLMGPVISNLDQDTLQFLMKLISDDQGPFLRVHISSKKTQNALDQMLNLSSVQDERHFASCVNKLCKAWPFRILRVKPPYSSRGYGHDASF